MKLTIAWAHKAFCVFCNKKGCYCVRAVWPEDRKPVNYDKSQGHIDVCQVCIYLVHNEIVKDRMMDSIPDDGTPVEIEVPK